MWLGCSSWCHVGEAVVWSSYSLQRGRLAWGGGLLSLGKWAAEGRRGHAEKNPWNGQ